MAKEAPHGPSDVSRGLNDVRQGLNEAPRGLNEAPLGLNRAPQGPNDALHKAAQGPNEVVLSGVTLTIDAADVCVGVVVARGCRPQPRSEALDIAVSDALAQARARSDVEATTGAVRTLLRHGRYKPTGRGKPASEYLLNAAREDRFPRLGTLVDINNVISLRWLLPISLVDLDRAASCAASDERAGEPLAAGLADSRIAFVVRRGRHGESYVFNAAGQSIDLEDLLLVAHLPGDRPCANPVKDSMETKLTEQSRDVMAVLYAPPVLRPQLAEATRVFGQALEEWAGASEVQTTVLPVR